MRFCARLESGEIVGGEAESLKAAAEALGRPWADVSVRHECLTLAAHFLPEIAPQYLGREEGLVTIRTNTRSGHPLVTIRTNTRSIGPCANPHEPDLVWIRTHPESARGGRIPKKRARFPHP